MTIKRNFLPAAVFVMTAMLMFTACQKSPKGKIEKHTPKYPPGTYRHSEPLSEFSSPHEIAQKVTRYINDGNEKAILAMMMPKEEYIYNIYPYTDAGTTLNALSGDDFWRIHIGLQRVAYTRKHISKYKGRIVRLEKAGEPEKTLSHNNGKIKIHRRIPLTLIVKNIAAGTRSVRDRNIMGVIIERNGKFAFFNTFD